MGRGTRNRRLPDTEALASVARAMYTPALEDKIAAATAASDAKRAVRYHKSGPLKGLVDEPWHLDCMNCGNGAGGSGLLDDQHNCVGVGCGTKAAENQDY